MSSFRGFFYGYFCFVSRVVARCSPLLCQRAVGASSALPGLPLLGGARRRLLASCGLSPAARCVVVGPGPCVPRRRGCGRLEAAGGGFWPARVAVVVKTTRYEFEQQRYRYAGLSEEDLKQLLALKGSNYAGLLERHRIHTKNMEHVIDSLRSEGHLCLPARYTQSFPEALQKLYRGDFRWQWQQRIRLYLEGTGINPTPVDLHEQQLSQEQHSRAHINERFQDQRSDISGPHLLPVRALNEVFIGESLSSRASYYEISVDDGPWEKQKSSGLNVCTGTGSKAWSYNINKVANQAVEEILKIAKKHGSLNMPLNTELVQKVTNDFNDSLLYSPEEPKMFFSIREPIVNRVLSSSRQRGFSSKVRVRSRCWDACMVVDGGTSFEFNDGAIASIMIDTEDALCTVLLEE
ncbi:NAD kinase 2, mitochondrial-like isoform 4-T5 [Morphnus guianensis]